MQELTYKNFFKFGYGNDFFNLKQSDQSIWNVSYRRCTQIPLKWNYECLRAAKLIRASTDRPIYICYSGGIDSEVCLLSFLNAGIPVVAAIMVFDNDLNSHDVSKALSFCEKRGVKYHIFKLDIINFWNFEIYKYSDPLSCISPQFPVLMKLMDMFITM